MRVKTLNWRWITACALGWALVLTSDCGVDNAREDYYAQNYGQPGFIGSAYGEIIRDR